MFAWLKRLFDRSDDPVYSCDLYRDKAAGSCAHVDGPLCDFPKCSMLADYRSEKEGMTIAGSGASELGKLMREQHWSVIDGIGNTLRAEALDAAVDAVQALPAIAKATGGAA